MSKPSLESISKILKSILFIISNVFLIALKLIDLRSILFFLNMPAVSRILKVFFLKRSRFSLIDFKFLILEINFHGDTETKGDYRICPSKEVYDILIKNNFSYVHSKLQSIIHQMVCPKSILFLLISFQLVI